ncbi:Pre-mRNA splicing factor-domain-containing protein [Infundibulicybe gibba]|nr:Pre-mRNA splicing factor-domain-containing protein [Infundibulicybe gibba]
MYTTPATGTSQNPNDLEDYLLGKKRVDKILTADENAKVGAAHKNFIAVQNANNARDIAAKIREDPLLAIKQQEQAAYQALISNPLRLREMQERNGIKPKKDKEVKKREKEERKRLKHERRHQKIRESRSPSPAGHRSDYRSPSPYHHHDNRSPRGDSRASRNRHSLATWPRSDDSEDNHAGGSGLRRNPDHHPDHGKRPRSRSPGRARTPPYKRTRMSVSPRRQVTNHSYNQSRNGDDKTNDRAARLAAMSTDASSMSVERQERLMERLEAEKAELAAEEHARQKSKGMVAS